MSDDSREFHKPVRRPAEVFDRLFSAEDPAEVSRAAHATATALLNRVRTETEDAVVERLVAYTDDHGIDVIAELWSRSPARSLPGAPVACLPAAADGARRPAHGGSAVRARSAPTALAR